MAQIDQIPVVTADEVVAGELLFGALHGAAEDELPQLGVVVEHPVLDLHIVDLLGVQPPDAVGQGQQDLAVLPLPGPPDGPGEPDGEGVVVHRLENEVQGTHGVAVDGVLGHVGHEHEHHVAVHAPQTPGGLHAVEPGHLDVQQDDVVLGRIVLQQVRAVGEEDDLEGLSGLPGVLLDVGVQLLPLLGLVLHDGDAHGSSSFPARCVRFPQPKFCDHKYMVSMGKSQFERCRFSGKWLKKQAKKELSGHLYPLSRKIE